MANDIDKIILETDTVIFVDDNTIGDIEFFGKRKVLPFLEKDGIYWGQLEDDEAAIHELERLRRSGADFIVFIKSTFWWFGYYDKFCDYLRSRYKK